MKDRLEKIMQIGVASVLLATHARTGRLARGFAAIVLLAGALASVSNVSAAASTVLIQGMLTTSSGTPVAGQIVYLYAWPGDSTLASESIGSTVPVSKLGEAITDRSGDYAIAASAAPVGGTNLQVASADASYFYTSEGSGATQTINLQIPPGAPSSLTKPSVPSYCSPYEYIHGYGPQTTNVGATFSIVDGVAMHFAYSNSQRSLLGIGYSTSGDWGSFKWDGTNSSSSTSSESYAWAHDVSGRIYRTQFIYHEFRQICGAGSGSRTYVAKSVSYAGGATTLGSQTPPYADWCVTQQASSSFTKDTSSAWTFGEGVDTSPSIGISLSAETGYSTGAVLKYEFSHAHSLCGTSAFPGGTPKMLVAGAP